MNAQSGSSASDRHRPVRDLRRRLGGLRRRAAVAAGAAAGRRAPGSRQRAATGAVLGRALTSPAAARGARRPAAARRRRPRRPGARARPAAPSSAGAGARGSRSRRGDSMSRPERARHQPGRRRRPARRRAGRASDVLAVRTCVLDRTRRRRARFLAASGTVIVSEFTKEVVDGRIRRVRHRLRADDRRHRLVREAPPGRHPAHAGARRWSRPPTSSSSCSGSTAWCPTSG